MFNDDLIHKATLSEPTGNKNGDGTDQLTHRVISCRIFESSKLVKDKMGKDTLSTTQVRSKNAISHGCFINGKSIIRIEKLVSVIGEEEGYMAYLE